MRISALLLAATLGLLPSRAANPPERVWITNVHLVSPERLTKVERGSVLIEDGRIARVVRETSTQPPKGATVIDGQLGYLTPGLIDAHVHLSGVPGMSRLQEFSQRAIVEAYRRQMPRSYLYYGYTTLVDLTNIGDDVREGFLHAEAHPDLYHCGAAIPLANGYPMAFAPTPLRFEIFSNFLYDARQADKIRAKYKPEEHTAEATVARAKALGGVCVKTFFERGFGANKNLPVMSVEMMRDVRKAATANGLLLMMHANAFEAQRYAVDGGADVIVHGMWQWGAQNKEPELTTPMKQLLDEIVAKRIGYEPTIQVLYGELAYFDADYLKRASLTKVVPAAMLDWFRSPAGAWFKQTIATDVPDAKMQSIFEDGPLRHVRQATAYLANHNAFFLFGTDTPSDTTYGNLPGLNAYEEMGQLRRAGLSLEQIFTAATLNNARALKLDAEIGTIEAGKIANLVLMRESPLTTLNAYDSISAVWLHGKRIAREGLAADAQR